MAIIRWLWSQPYLLLILTTAMWGGNAVAGKMAVGHISPFLLTLSRWGFAMLIIWPLAWPHVRREWPKIRPALPIMLALGACGFALFNNLLYVSLQYTSAINVTILQASMPLLVFVLNFFFFQIRSSAVQIGGLMLTIVGVLAIASRGSLANLIALNFNIGDLINLGAVVLYGFYTVFLRKKPELHWLSNIAIMGIAGLAMSLPFAFYDVVNGSAIFPDATGWGIIAYTAIGPSILSQVFWIRGMELVGSNRGGIFYNMIPVFGTLLAIVILGEKFLPYHAAGFVLVMGGVWIAQRAGRKL